MNIEEYEKVKELTYLEYCDYLQQKYGIGLCDYMTQSWSANPKCSRTKDGLFAHHKYEDHAIRLSDKEYAMKNPFEWQLAENIVYCDYLEHLLLHILICENPAVDKNENEVVGIGGILQYLIPELNDLYSVAEAKKRLEEMRNKLSEDEATEWADQISSWEPRAKWKRNCQQLVANDKEVFFVLLKRFKLSYEKHYKYNRNSFCKSLYERRSLFSMDKWYRFWRMSFVKDIYKQIRIALT
ncbi:MAG: hypothetical protein J1G38_00295 [Clostridiales bacterium]|nr:hypothetical protein [Clostridiales bacterium]